MQLRGQLEEKENLRFELEVSRMHHIFSSHSVYYVGSFRNHFIDAIFCMQALKEKFDAEQAFNNELNHLRAQLREQGEELIGLRGQLEERENLRSQLEVSRIYHMSSLHSVYYVGSLCNHLVNCIIIFGCRPWRRN